MSAAAATPEAPAAESRRLGATLALSVALHAVLILAVGFAPEAAVAPGELFPALERLGMTRLFDHHVMALIGRELERHPDAVIGVNLSGASASCDGWWLPLLDRLESAPALARRLGALAGPLRGLLLELLALASAEPEEAG